MKHIPILFSTAMVQAILEGRKTQTRRTKGLEDMADSKFKYKGIPDGLPATHAFARMFNGHWVETIHKFCPYGQPGDVLWVRETFSTPYVTQRDNSFLYAADFKSNAVKHAKGIWKPNIHMPKKACRIWLEVVSVRVERIQDISDSDAIAEGIEGQNDQFKNYNKKYPVEDFIGGATAALRSFQSLWKTIHEGKDSDWNNNPWVWVVEFKQIEKPNNF